MTSGNEALSDITVLELAFYYPGPLCGLLLSDLGAEVIKIESPDGDPMRAIGATGGQSSSPGFAALNRGKKSVVIDLKTPEGHDEFLKLLARTDVLLQVLRPSVMERLGLGPELIRQTAPRLVHCVLTGYGATGPWADRAGHDINYQSLAGVVSMTGISEDALAIPGVPLADLTGALMATLNVVASLRERDRTGQGRTIDISLTEGALMANSLNLLGAGFGYEKMKPRQTMLTGLIPAYNLYRSKDGSWFALGALEPKFWVEFVTAAECEELMGAQFDPSAVQKLSDIFASADAAHWTALSQKHDVCLEPVLDAEHVTDHPLHVARGAFWTDGSGTKYLSIPGFDRPSEDRMHAPSLGEHDEEILSSKSR
jgi:crotonobetainyl-CoA:carnitine CoA-transferase CaiB-like acyl-CoA transferase